MPLNLNIAVFAVTNIILFAVVKIDDELFRSLQDDLMTCRAYLRQVAQGMLRGAVSKYPIFVALRSELDFDLGLPIVSREESDLTWSFNASHLEDFVNHQVVPEAKLDEFKTLYKNPDEYMCVFVAEEGFTSFVFMRYEDPEAAFKITPEQLN